MKKHKNSYQLKTFHYVDTQYPIQARKEIAFDIQLAAQLLLDDLISEYNKASFDREVNHAIDNHDNIRLLELSKNSHHYLLEY